MSTAPNSGLDPAILAWHAAQSPGDRAICERLADAITRGLPGAEAKVWHRHPVWFLAGNPIVGYSRQKPGVRLMFWSGADFDEPGLDVVGGKFKDASVFLHHVDDIAEADLARWLAKSARIQWDYKNLVRRKGWLERIA